MAEEVVVDTYALMAMVFGELSRRAEEVMQAIYKGEVRGIIPPPVAYEFALQWCRGRIPGLKSMDEVVAFLKAYFTFHRMDLEDYARAALLKARGDKLLASARNPDLRGRRLSLTDAAVIVVAGKRKAPIVTNDKDLAYVASHAGAKVIW